MLALLPMLLVCVSFLSCACVQYSFPPSSVGETGRIGMPSRREIGHGTLAERALEPCIPSAEAFPYSMRLESNITESNGSSRSVEQCKSQGTMKSQGVMKS